MRKMVQFFGSPRASGISEPTLPSHDSTPLLVARRGEGLGFDGGEGSRGGGLVLVTSEESRLRFMCCWGLGSGDGAVEKEEGRGKDEVA
jgi:hypothetical protein